MMKKIAQVKHSWNYCLSNLVSKPMKKRSVVLQKKLRVFLKQAQPKTVTNQHIVVERNQKSRKKNWKKT